MKDLRIHVKLFVTRVAVDGYNCFLIVLVELPRTGVGDDFERFLPLWWFQRLSACFCQVFWVKIHISAEIKDVSLCMTATALPHVWDVAETKRLILHSLERKAQRFMTLHREDLGSDPGIIFPKVEVTGGRWREQRRWTGRWGCYELAGRCDIPLGQGNETGVEQVRYRIFQFSV